MALISKRDIDEVRSRTNIAEIVGDHVTLKSAGADSMKGLCPFHDERTPSFHVRPQSGYFHCFGCGESGDVYSFLQKTDHVTFAEAVEKLAARIGYELSYEDGGEAPDRGRRTRLLAAHTDAEAFFRSQLATADAGAAHEFLGGRGFDAEAAARFGVGYAPKGWDALTSHLRGLGYTMEELRESGLVSTNDRGSSYDRFRGRVMWPIRDTSGQTVGFGARKLFDDDQGPKYLNTPETTIYRKAQVLYGLDLAKRAIAREHRVVVVEGYTDVMAAQLSGIECAVATCGTAFGVDHIRILRRIMDDESGTGKVVFTFDPDDAGQKAAMRAFQEERRFTAQTFVAVAPDGLDPCDLRLAHGPQAVVDLVERATPMYEFVIRRRLAEHDLDTVEGRVAALRQTAPVVATIRDPAVRPGYARLLAGWLGMDVPMVERAVQNARRSDGDGDPGRDGRGDRGDGGHGRDPRGATPMSRPAGAPAGAAPDPFADGIGAMAPVRAKDLPADPITRLERDTLMAVLQHPGVLPAERLDRVLACEFANPSLATVRDAIMAARLSLGSSRWVAAVAEEAPRSFASLVPELAVAPLPAGPDQEHVIAYVQAIAASLIERDLLRQKAALIGSLQRTDPKAEPERFRALQAQIAELEAEKRRLRGDD